MQPGTLLDANGQVMSSGQVGISTVPPELVRDMLPPGVLQHTFDITIQAPGVAAFATPLEITFPNVFEAAPGTKLNFLSFDHTTGKLVIEGTATVSEDGKSVTTDPGQGITKPGWDGVTPSGSQTGPGKPPPPKGTLSIEFRLVQLEPSSPFGFIPVLPYAAYTDAASFTDWTVHTVHNPIGSLGAGPTAIEVRVTPADPKDLDTVSLHAFAKSTTSGSVNVEYLWKNLDSKEYLLYSDLTLRKALVNSTPLLADPPMAYHLHATSGKDYEDAAIKQSCPFGNAAKPRSRRPQPRGG